jgi:hypothetical protein
MIRTKLPWAAALMLCAGLAGAALPPLAADSAALDRSYIPALMLSNGRDIPKAQAAHQAYERAWAAFAENQRRAWPGDAGWDRILSEAEKANGEARAALASGKTAAAHSAQEKVRHALWHKRQALKSAYHPDLLTEYHETMEELIGTAAGKDAAAMNAEDIASLRKLLATARSRWKAVTGADWDPADYGLDGARLESYRAALVAEDRALDALAEALDEPGATRVAKAAAAIKAPFARAYAAFGVFPQ